MHFPVTPGIIILLAIIAIIILVYLKDKLSGVKLMLLGTSIMLIALIIATGNRMSDDGILILGVIGLAISITGLFIKN